MSAHPLESRLQALYATLRSAPVWQAIADRETIVTAAITIQQIPAPTFAEEQRARFVYDQMINSGLEQVHMDALHNVYGCLPGQAPGPGVLVSAHTDTVFAPDTDLTIRRTAERVYGPGIVDNSISVAALLHLARTLRQQQIRAERTLWFVANTGEEGLGDLRGMRAAVDALHDQVATVIVIDSAYGAIVHGGVASRRYRISTQTAGGHSWQDFGAPSAIHVLVQFAARVIERKLPQTPKCTFNIGVIEGGTTINAIARHASLLLDLRSESEASLAALVQQVEELISATAARHPAVTLRAEIVGDRPGGSLSQTDPLVQLAAAAYRALGATVTFEAASTDANVPLSRGIPAVCIGMCQGGNAHRLDEYLDVADIPAGMRALLLLVLTAAQRQP